VNVRAREINEISARDYVRGEGTATAGEFVRGAGKGGWVVLTGIPGGDANALPPSEARGRGLNIKIVRRVLTANSDVQSRHQRRRLWISDGEIAQHLAIAHGETIITIG
jgi:hypothetical protein